MKKAKKKVVAKAKKVIGIAEAAKLNEAEKPVFDVNPVVMEKPVEATPSSLSLIKHDLLTVDEVADYLRIKVTSLYRLTREKKIPFYKIGGSIRFKKVEMESYLESQCSHPVVPFEDRRKQETK